MKKLLTVLKEKIFSKRYAFEKELRRAIKNNEFIFHYQPEIDLKTGQATGFEALMRWNHPTKGLIPPMEFIPMMEETKLINKMTPFLFEQSMKDLRAIHDAGYGDLFMSVNISVVQLQDKELVNTLKHYLKKYGIDTKYYECELTETSMMEDLPEDLAMLEKVNSLKIRLSLDDFGSGYASFNYLRQLDIQKMKIDREFTWSIPGSKENETIVSTMIKLGKDLNLAVLAEGIETKEQIDWLMGRGCDLGQGFYFARPLPLNELFKWLEKNKQHKTGKVKGSAKPLLKSAVKPMAKSAAKSLKPSAKTSKPAAKASKAVMKNAVKVSNKSASAAKTVKSGAKSGRQSVSKSKAKKK